MFNKKKERIKILVVEDDALLARVLGESLSSADFEVEIVANGLEALDAAKKFGQRFIILDLILPGLHGFGVLQQFKSDEIVKDVPVAVLSNLNSPADVKSVKALGAENYFIKANTEMKQIIQFVKAHLKKKPDTGSTVARSKSRT